jgi:hypothetical protein
MEAMGESISVLSVASLPRAMTLALLYSGVIFEILLAPAASRQSE